MRLHRGGGRVVAHARRGLGGQAIGTGIRHRQRERPASLAMGAHRVSMVQLTLRARLMPRIRRTARLTSALLAAVDLSAIIELADVEDRCAPRATNRDQHLVDIHASTATAALMKVAPPVRLRAPFPRSASTRDTKAQGSYPWAFIFRGREDPLRDVATRRHFSADGSMRAFLRISAIVNMLSSAAPEVPR